jgi:hypothetical protein
LSHSAWEVRRIAATPRSENDEVRDIEGIALRDPDSGAPHVPLAILTQALKGAAPLA